MENFSITDYMNYNLNDFSLNTINFELYNGDIMNEVQSEISKTEVEMTRFEQLKKTDDEGESEYTLNEYLKGLEDNRAYEIRNTQSTLETLEEGILTLGIQAERLISSFAEETQKIEDNVDLTENGKRKRYNDLHDKYTQDLSEIAQAQGYIIENKGSILNYLAELVEDEVSTRDFEELTVDKIMYINGILQGDKSLSTRKELAKKMNHHPIALELINKNKEDENDENITQVEFQLVDELKKIATMNKVRNGQIDLGNRRVQAKSSETLRGFNGGVGGKVTVLSDDEIRKTKLK